LNVSIPAGEFSIKALGIYDGIRISDNRTGREGAYIYSQAGGEKLLQELEKISEENIIPESIKSLAGKKLPDITTLGLELPLSDINNKRLLVCFFDYEQRPSRNCVMQLSTRAQELKAQGVEIVAIQASKIDKSTLDEWIKESNISMSVGMVEKDAEQVLLKWSVKALPWLILTDAEHKITAEGFAVTELDGKITIQ
jgi:hypothetical protein